MNVLHLHPGADTGGTSAGAKVALEAAGDEVRVFVKSFHRFEYPQSTFWDAAAVDESIDWADVVIVHNDPATWAAVSRGRVKPLIVLHHGSRFRRYAAKLYPEAASLGAVQLVSTVDLLLSVPTGGEAWWIPQALDTGYMAQIAAANAHAPNSPIRVTHAPTNRAIKGTSYVVRSVRQMRGAVALQLIERKPWGTCLALKAQSDLFVDQLRLGYGNNAAECWGMGMPVIAGAPGSILARMQKVYGRRPPFAIADKYTIGQRIAAMAGSADMRAEWAAEGMAHVNRFHAPEAFAGIAHDIYDRAIRGVASRTKAA